MRRERGTTLLVLLLLAWLAIQWGRVVLREEGPPAFFVEEREGVLVMLGEGFFEPGVHQFSDGITPMGVIQLTGLEMSENTEANTDPEAPLISGESLTVVCEGRKILDLGRSWMPAGQRLALGIPLHPDRMSREDWEVLPGLGPKLAERIEADRQENGDFGSLEALRRVRGIGPKRIESWRSYFSGVTTH